MNIRSQIQFKLFHRNSCFAIGSKGDAVGRLRGVDPCGHGLLAIVGENFDAVFIQQDAELERTVLAAYLAAAAVSRRFISEMLPAPSITMGL